jgi:hypothetical protein
MIPSICAIWPSLKQFEQVSSHSNNFRNIWTSLDKYRPIWKMANSLILAGFGMAALSMSGRIAARFAPRAISNIENLIKSMPLQNWSKAWANSKYYKGGFQLKMTKREVTSVKFSPS